MSLKITVEFSVENPNIILDKAAADKLKHDLEPLLVNKQLADFLWKIGVFTDAEVVNISSTESYDTKQ